MGFKMPREILTGIEKVLQRNVNQHLGMSLAKFRKEPLRFLKHTEQVRFIDSIYRNNM